MRAVSPREHRGALIFCVDGGVVEGKAAREEMQRQKSNAEIIFRLPVSWVQISAATEAGRLGKGSWGCVAAGIVGCACVQPAGAQLPCLCSPVPISFFWSL